MELTGHDRRSGAQNASPLLTAADVATRFSTGIDTVYRLAHTRQLPYVRIASCMRFRVEDVEAFVAGEPVGPPETI